MKYFEHKVTSLDLNNIIVRPVFPEERKLWKQLVAKYHYLGFQSTFGKQILYVATIDDIWVALIGWSGAALKSCHRDNWIGWDNAIKEQKLKFIVNNFRYLILPNIKVKNLASKVLSLNVKRLSQDWEKFYHHPIYLAETFVDATRHKGTCYLAAGWKMLGKTKGFSRLKNGYVFNGKPKKLFVLPLDKRSLSLLSDPIIELKNREVLIVDWKRLPLEGKGGLIDVLDSMSDFRERRGKRFQLVGVLGIAICALLSGAIGFEGIADWAKKLRERELKKFKIWRKVAPSLSTFKRVLGGINAPEFDERICRWLRENNFVPIKKISLDGKTLRGSHDGDKKAIHLLSALVHDERVSIGQVEVEEDTNEIPKLKDLLDPMDIEKSIITADAIQTQVENARYIVMEKKSRLSFHC